MVHPKNDQLFPLLVNNLPAAMVISKGNKTEIIYQNQPNSRLLSTTQFNLSTRNSLHSELRLRRALLNGEIKNEECLTFQLQDGSCKWIQVHILPLMKNRYKTGIIAFFTDITESVQQQEKLKEQEALRSEIIKTVAHDLKNPFSGLLIFTDFLSDCIQNKSFEQAHENIRLLKGCITNALDTSNKLLEWALSSNSNYKPQLVTVPLYRFTQNIVDELQTTARLKQLQLKTDIPHDFYGYFDQDMIASCIRILLSNAIKFSHPGGRIELSIKKNQESTMFSVRDYGLGLNEKQLARFNFTGKLDKQHGTNGESGNGIGLSISKNFIELHGGKLWAESIPGKGSNFIFTLPDKKKL